MEDHRLLIASCVILGKSFNLSNLPFSYRLTDELLNYMNTFQIVLNRILGFQKGILGAAWKSNNNSMSPSSLSGVCYKKLRIHP